MTDLAPYFLCLCQKFLSKKAKFLITMRAIKSFDTIPFVSSCKFRNSCHNKRPNFLTQWEQSKVLTPCFFVFTCAWRLIVNKKAKQDTQLQSVLQQKKPTEFLITSRAIDRFGTILFMPVSEIPVKKGQISYHNESN